MVSAVGNLMSSKKELPWQEEVVETAVLQQCCAGVSVVFNTLEKHTSVQAIPAVGLPQLRS